jgi:hypothetical protein
MIVLSSLFTAAVANHAKGTKWQLDEVVEISGSTDYCDGHLGQWCLLKDRIPCHDLSCQIPAQRHPTLKCAGTADACAALAAPLCASTLGCVAFAVIHTQSPPWVEWYNATASSNPLNSPDWNYYFNESALGPPPMPPPTCVPGPSKCPAAPSDSIFPPPGDYPPGCNQHGCSTLPQNLMPSWTPTYVYLLNIAHNCHR